jgi:hypothetical protein
MTSQTPSNDQTGVAKPVVKDAPKAPDNELSTFLRGHITLIHVGDRTRKDSP